LGAEIAAGVASALEALPPSPSPFWLPLLLPLPPHAVSNIAVANIAANNVFFIIILMVSFGGKYTKFFDISSVNCQNRA
jgi:hypothetical protein